MNSSTDFCLRIEAVTTEQKAWLTTQFRHTPAGPDTEENTRENLEDIYGPLTALQYGMKREDVTGHDIAIELRNVTDGTQSLYLQNTDSGETGVLHHLLVAFTAAFPDRAPITVQWAYNCDRPSPDAFGGGAEVYYQGESYYCDTTQYVATVLDRIDRRARRFDILPPDPQRYYLRYVSFTTANLGTLPTECGGTIDEAIENAAEAKTRARLKEITSYGTSDWTAYYSRIKWHAGIATIAIALAPYLAYPIPPSEQEPIVI